jgi:hypothetical protein
MRRLGQKRQQRRRRVFVLLVLAGLLLPSLSRAGVCLDKAREAEQAFGIPTLMLQSIVMQESGDNPWALNVDGEGLYPANQAEAKAMLREKIYQSKNVDIGCGQISMKYHSKYFGKDVFMALDPWVNMVYASKILLDNYRTYGTWTEAVARYHSPNQERQQAYLCLVMTRMAQLKGMRYRCKP